jgi:endonuclease G
MAILGQAQDWQATLAASPLAAEFGVPAGLPLQTKALAEAELKNRPVAVIGHPLSGNAGGDPADIAIVYGDAQLGLKRFMPGSLDDAQPLLTESSQTFLAHDCSTLGGASGGCLVDLLTGRVLGIHISGNATLTNRAVPIWVLPGLTPAANLSSPTEP